MPTHSRKTILLATDQQRSVLNALNANGPHPIAYSPYGHRQADNALLSLLGFNGERPDPLTGHYHLGNGYRQFNPVLMRFNSPDSWSPFGKGGINSYVYCLGDPVNGTDQSGRTPNFFKPLLRKVGLMKPSTVKGVRKASNTSAYSVKALTTPPLNSDKDVSQLGHKDFVEKDIDWTLFDMPDSPKARQASNSKNHDEPPHRGKHFPPKRPETQPRRYSLPTFDVYLEDATAQELINGFHETRYALGMYPTPKLERIGNSYEQAMLNRAIRESSQSQQEDAMFW